MSNETSKPLLSFCRICWLPLTLVFFALNFMTLSWYIEEKNLSGSFYLFDYMTAHMEREKAVDLYYFMCNLSFGYVNFFLVYSIAIILALMQIFIVYHEIRSKKSHFFKWILYLLILLVILFISFIAYPIAYNAYWNDIASI